MNNQTALQDEMTKINEANKIITNAHIAYTHGSITKEEYIKKLIDFCNIKSV